MKNIYEERVDDLRIRAEKEFDLATGINSPHNACMFRADCRKAEAALAERDAEIARLRKVLGWVAQNPEERAYWLGSVTALVAGGGKMSCPHGEWHDCEICKQLDVKDAEIARLRDVLTSKGFVECGIPACNCGAWHHRYGLPERWAEIKELLIDADVLNNDTGNTPLNAIKKLIAQRDGLQEAAVVGSPRLSAEPVAWIRHFSDGSYEGPIMHKRMEDVRKKSGAWTPLFAKREEVARLREDAAEQVAKERGET